jgi:hypothetical protein
MEWIQCLERGKYIPQTRFLGHSIWQMAPQGHLLTPSLGNIYNQCSFLDCSFKVHLYYVNIVNCLLQLEVESFILYGSIISNLGLIVKDLPKMTRFLSYCNQKRRNTQNASRRSVWPHPLRTQFVLSEVQFVCYFPDLLQLDGCCAGPTQCTCDHTDGEHEPHASRRNEQLDPWPRILNSCSASASPNITDRHRSTSQNLFVLYFTENI